MIIYRPRRLAAATRGGFTVWGPHIAGLILQPLCLELGLLVPMWRWSTVGCMHWTNQCKGSSRRPTSGTWSCKSGTKEKKSSWTSNCSPWSRGWRLCTHTSSRCRVAVCHLVHSLHHLLLHLHLHHLRILHMTAYPIALKTFRILTMINIRSF